VASLEEIRAERLAKLAALREAGIATYPIGASPEFTWGQARESFAKLAKRQKPLTLAGRVQAIRGQGAVIFFDLDDGSGSGQVLLKKDEVKDEEIVKRFTQTVDVGDFLAVKGKLFLTKSKEQTLLASEWTMLAKSLRPLPDKWHGLQDTEERFRRRYLDSLMAPEVKGRFERRSQIITLLRQILDKENFLEVETPVLQPLAGGASAEPFSTHHRALNIDLYLRVAEELYLKRLLVGNFPRVYSIGKNFRNEGIDREHNPEFTMLEWYQAYSNLEEQMGLVEKVFVTLVKKLAGGGTLTYQEEKIDFKTPFTRVSYFDLLRRHALVTNPESASQAELLLKATQLGLNLPTTETREKILDAIYKKACRPQLRQPTLIVDYPASFFPLAKHQEEHPELSAAFQLVVAGSEMVKAFAELNDPLEQRARFEAQEAARAAGDTEAQRLDEDFIEAMEYGLPPAGGVGIGIDRLTMLLTDAKNIREVIYFPTLRPRE
jgi:lysyl-tRNA synthetase class 2